MPIPQSGTDGEVWEILPANASHPHIGSAREKTLQTLLEHFQAGGGGDLVDVTDKAARELGLVTVKNPTTDPETGLAKETTLQERALETTLQSVLDALTPVHKASHAAAVSVAAGTELAIVSFTPAIDVTVTGFAADRTTTTLDFAYRLLLVVGGVPLFNEALATDVNSFTPAKVSVAAGVPIEVRTRNPDLTAHTFSGSLFWSE